MRADGAGGAARVTGVTGGSTGVAAAYAAMRSLADTFDESGSRLRGWSALGARTVTEPDLVESAPLSPLTFAEAEAAVAAATTGPCGVLAESFGWEGDAVLVRALVAAFETTDQLVRATVQTIDRLVGHVAGTVLTPAAPLLLVTLPHLPAGARRDLEQWVVDHPGVVRHAADGGGGLLEGLWDGLTPFVPGGPLGTSLLVPDTAAAAGLLAALFGARGTGQASVRDDLTVPGSGAQPPDLPGLLSHLHEVALLSEGADSPDNGTIEIQTLDAGTGDVRHIVYLPGTDDMATLPWTQDEDVRDLPTDLLNLSGGPDAYQQGILQAMAQAGIGPHDPVLLVGHSLGGMEAASILSHGTDFNVTNVVTAGSPTAQLDGFPAGSHVLSLEHQGDVVPLVDGADNPDSVEQVTVTFDDGAAGIVEGHGYPHYLAGAAAVGQSTDPAVHEQLQSLQAHGFLASGTGPGPTVTSHVYQVVREP